MEGEQFVHNNYLTRNVWSGVFFGLGLIAFIDEGVFHQLLHWHHFYAKSTLEVGLVSDGFFHAFSWFATIAGLFMVADLRRRRVWIVKRWWGGVLLGAGLFQLYDGLIQHKIFGLHQIRYVDNVIYYDWVWNVIAVIMIAAGGMLLKATGKMPQNKREKKVHGA
ncbi:DUF2243 domain-containing protein [Fictibacillus sp. S7]|uniref:DUF2243 domain-containing protein n=1 Tax=Fictibacillus sp. S7 TaxID=2212476 RepID=UPI001012CEA3|nr:DUF2243 domain-containing protein [Fictibacillus sp. S7]RXY99935.1 DUF2243 domain-containing protein [Fictibacillus sp. S7]